jgi:hypothetical protein
VLHGLATHLLLGLGVGHGLPCVDQLLADDALNFEHLPQVHTAVCRACRTSAAAAKVEKRRQQGMLDSKIHLFASVWADLQHALCEALQVHLQGGKASLGVL